MGFFSDVFGGGDKQSTAQATNPAWVNDAGKNNYAALMRTVNRPYQAYTKDRTADATGAEKEAWASARSGLGTAMKGADYDAAGNYIKQGMGTQGSVTVPGELSAEYRNEMNPYDSVESLMNPYVDAMLDPAIRRIRESGDIARNNMGAEATSAGAFGDYRHGIEESLLYRDEAQNIGDLTANTHGTAFDKAMAERTNRINTLLGLQQGDVTNKMTAQTTNAGLREAYMNRLLGGGAALGNLETANTQNQLDWINAAAGAGQQERALTQADRDFDYAQFLEGRDWNQESINALMSALNSTPYNRKTISNQEGSGAAGGVGSVIGSILSAYGNS